MRAYYEQAIALGHGGFIHQGPSERPSRVRPPHWGWGQLPRDSQSFLPGVNSPVSGWCPQATWKVGSCQLSAAGTCMQLQVTSGGWDAGHPHGVGYNSKVQGETHGQPKVALVRCSFG